MEEGRMKQATAVAREVFGEDSPLASLPGWLCTVRPPPPGSRALLLSGIPNRSSACLSCISGPSLPQLSCQGLCLFIPAALL